MNLSEMILYPQLLRKHQMRTTARTYSNLLNCHKCQSECESIKKFFNKCDHYLKYYYYRCFYYGALIQFNGIVKRTSSYIFIVMIICHLFGNILKVGECMEMMDDAKQIQLPQLKTANANVIHNVERREVASPSFSLLEPYRTTKQLNSMENPSKHSAISFAQLSDDNQNT